MPIVNPARFTETPPKRVPCKAGILYPSVLGMPCIHTPLDAPEFRLETVMHFRLYYKSGYSANYDSCGKRDARALEEGCRH